MIKNFLSDDEPEPAPAPAPQVRSKPAAPRSASGFLNLFETDDADGQDPDNPEPFVISRAEPASMAETVRQSGLAWSAGVAFFAAVVFMLVLGWGADVLLGTSPWGIVGGIVLGSTIGFIQFFRLTSQIFKK